MVLVQIGIPSGFVPETDNLNEIEIIRKTEFEGRNLVIYLEEVRDIFYINEKKYRQENNCRNIQR